MRTLPIRVWFGLAISSSLLIPFLIGVLLLAAGVIRLPNQEREQVMEDIEAASAYWSDPVWQAATSARLAPLHIDVVLWDVRGREIFRTNGLASNLPRVTPEGSLVLRPVGPDTEEWIRSIRGTDVSAYYSVPRQIPEWTGFLRVLPRLAPFAVSIVAAVIAVWLIGRSVLIPLAAMSRASRRIARGDFDFDLPPSRLREVAEVGGAFTAMGAELRAAMSRQVEVEQERRFLIGAIAHDLRTPLFALRGHLEALQKGIVSDPSQIARYVAVCQDKANQLEGLIADLFAYTRLEYLDHMPRREWFALDKLLRGAAEGVQPQAAAKRVELRVDGPREDGYFMADAQLLARAVGNLLDNALQHAPDDGHVWLNWRRVEDQLFVVVSDDGPGILPDDLPHIFAPFHRGDPSRSRRTGGAGLGLSIARRIIEAHGGGIAASNRADGGAEFVAWLPAPRYAVATPHEPAPPASTVG